MARARRFTARRKWVSYGGHRWRLELDRGRWLLLSRSRGAYMQWIPAAAAK